MAKDGWVVWIGCTQQPESCPINQALHAPLVSASSKLEARMYSVPAPAPALVMTFSTRPPRDRLSFFVPAYGQIHERSDAGTLSHAPARAQAFH